MFGEHGTNDVWKTWHCVCMCKTSLSKVHNAFFNEGCLATSDLPIDCAVYAADHFLQNYLAAYQLPNQALLIVASFGYVVLSFAGGYPDLMKAKEEGKLQRSRVAFFVWTVLQIATILFLVAAILVVFIDYVSATTILSQCMVRIGSASVLHLVAATSFFLLPAVTTKVFAFILTLLSLLAGLKGNGLTSMDVVYAIEFSMFWLSILLGFLPMVYWILTGYFVFSIMTLPIPIITLMILPLTTIILQKLNRLFGIESNGAVFLLANPKSPVDGVIGGVIYFMLIWMCLAPWVSSSYFLAFSLYQKGAGAPYENWLHYVFTYLFAEGFSRVNLKLPDAMNLLEAFSNLGALTDVMEKLTELTGNFYEVEPSAFYDEASRLGSVSLAFSLLKAIAVAANLMLNLKSNLGVPMQQVGKVLLQSTLNETWRRLTSEKKADADILKKLLKLKEIDATECGVTDDIVTALAEALKQQELRVPAPRLVKIHPVEDSKATPETIGRTTDTANAQDSNGRKGNPQILWLGGNDITSAGASALAEALATNRTLETLWLSRNRIGADGAAALAQALAANTTLKELGLDYNSIGDDRAAALAQALATNTTLQGLRLGGNDISPQTEAVLKAAWENSSIWGGVAGGALIRQH